MVDIGVAVKFVGLEPLATNPKVITPAFSTILVISLPVGCPDQSVELGVVKSVN